MLGKWWMVETIFHLPLNLQGANIGVITPTVYKNTPGTLYQPQFKIAKYSDNLFNWFHRIKHKPFVLLTNQTVIGESLSWVQITWMIHFIFQSVKCHPINLKSVNFHTFTPILVNNVKTC